MADVSPTPIVAPLRIGGMPTFQRHEDGTSTLVPSIHDVPFHHADRWALDHVQDGAARTRLRIVALDRPTTASPEFVAAAVLEAPASDWPGAGWPS